MPEWVRWAYSARDGLVHAAVVAYGGLGWPVTARDEQVSLNLDLDLDAVALVIPTELAARVGEILVGRRCSPAVLAPPRYRCTG